MTVREIITTLESLTWREGLVNFGGRPEHPTDPPFVCADIGRLAGATRWSPESDLDHGLGDVVERWRARQAVA